MKLKTQLPGFLAGLATMLGIVNGVPALIDRVTADDPVDFQAGSPPQFVVETSVRRSPGPFTSSLAGLEPGDRFQAVVQALNNGGGDATNVELRAELGEGLSIVPGSCQQRTSSKPHPLARCPDNIVRGGFSYERFGRGGWAQVYFDVLIPPSSNRENVFTVAAVGDAAETAEQRDTAVVGVAVSRQRR